MTEQEFTRLFGLYRRLVYHVAYCNIGDAAEAEDISQEVFLKLYTRPPAYDEDVQVKSWLIRVTVNRCRDVRRTLRFRLTEHTEEEPIAPPPSETNELLEAVMSLSPKIFTNLPLITIPSSAASMVPGKRPKTHDGNRCSRKKRMTGRNGG